MRENETEGVIVAEGVREADIDFETEGVELGTRVELEVRL